MGEKSSGISRNVEKVACSLFSESHTRESFLDAITRGESAITAVATIHGATYPGAAPAKPPWLPSWISVAGPDERPGKDDRHIAGDIYCLDLSSTFACAALSVISGETDVLLDLCAAPGGKSILASRYLKPRFTIANEVIRKRAAQLIANYKRCRIDPAIVTSRDPAVLGKLVPRCARIAIVDAPCSGQSLVLKDLAAPGAFHPATISMNARRQRRILACAAGLIQPGGYLLYSTCTFSREENEDNIEWFLKQHSTYVATEVPLLEEYRSPLSAAPCYRLFPQSGFGAGSFCALLRCTESPREEGERTLEELTDVIKPMWRSPHVFALCPVPVKGREGDQGGQPRGRVREGRRRGGKGRTKRFWPYDE